MHHCESLEDDPANYEENSKEFGVNYRSKLLELKYFDICGGGLVADVMHDLLEGTLQYEAKLVLKHVIGQRNTGDEAAEGDRPAELIAATNATSTIVIV